VATTNDLKNGLVLNLDGQLWSVVEFQHVKPGKGGAFVRTKVRNIATGAVLDKTFRAGEKFERMHTQSRKMAFLYATEEEVVLMDNDTYEQVSVSPAMAEDALEWVVENMEVEIMYLNGQPFEVAAPNFVELVITQSDPGVQGNTAQGATKPATLESGVTIQVPLFIEEGEKVKVDTRSGEYLGRA
jgi:elongation factor P